jgi:hypothetical protein
MPSVVRLGRRHQCDLPALTGSVSGQHAVDATCNLLDGEAAVFARKDRPRNASTLDATPVLTVDRALGCFEEFGEIALVESVRHCGLVRHRDPLKGRSRRLRVFY